MPIFVGTEFSIAHFTAIFGHIGTSTCFPEGSEKIGYGKLWSNLSGHFKKNCDNFLKIDSNDLEF